MEIQILDLISSRERKKDITYDVDLKAFKFEGDYIKPIGLTKVQGNVTSDNEIIIIKAHINVELELKCSRCLETFVYPIDIDIEERFTNDQEHASEEDVAFVKGDSINITEIIENSIISTLPIKRLCKVNCKGLCQNCGADLNKDGCNCNNEDVDLRLAGLEALLDNKEV